LWFIWFQHDMSQTYTQPILFVLGKRSLSSENKVCLIFWSDLIFSCHAFKVKWTFKFWNWKQWWYLYEITYQFVDCKNGYYGANCAQRCGQCKHGTFCDSTTGLCPEGCDGHWDGPLCSGMISFIVHIMFLHIHITNDQKIISKSKLRKT
jgi:hypothetical protein